MPPTTKGPLHDDPMWDTFAPVSAKTFAQLLGISPASFYRGRRTGLYPAGAQLSTKRHAWTFREVLTTVERTRGVVL